MLSLKVKVFESHVMDSMMGYVLVRHELVLMVYDSARY